MRVRVRVIRVMVMVRGSIGVAGARQGEGILSNPEHVHVGHGKLTGDDGALGGFVFG